jgi:predicted regulator of Ras-like GTPase activity (Roadblock/LC7/MglB family)
MGTKLLELWLINQSGLPYAHVQNDDISDSSQIANLFSGFLSAVESIAADKIDAIKMKDSKILIYPIKEPIQMFVVGRAKVKVKDAQIRKLLKKVKDSFAEKFGDILSSWFGDQSIFSFWCKEIKKEYF